MSVAEYATPAVARGKLVEAMTGGLIALGPAIVTVAEAFSD